VCVLRLNHIPGIMGLKLNNPYFRALLLDVSTCI